MKKDKQTNFLADLRQSDRVYRLDRDCLLVYTGRDARDARPFLRIGTGQSMPPELLKHIENVVLTEQELGNAAQEMSWMKATLGAGGESVRYVGSKERVSQMYAYAGLSEMDEEKRPPVKVAPYGPFNSRVETKNKCMILFMATGNIQASLSSSKLLDYFSYRNQRLNIDREYDLISRALHRRERRAEKGTGFIFPGGSSIDRLSLYWFFDGKGLYLHPPENHHYDLLENAVDPANLVMAMSDSIHAPGFAEFVRRKSVLKEKGGVYCHDMEHISFLKRIYNGMAWKIFDDGRPLPMADHTVLFKSKTGSHGVFSMRMHEHATDHVQVMFPLAPVKQNRTLDFTRGPYDLEFLNIDAKEQFPQTLPSRLVLHAPGRIAPDVYGKQKLAEGLYPLVPGAEYIFHNPEVPIGTMDHVLSALKDMPQQELFQSLTLTALAARPKTQQDVTDALAGLKAWEKIHPPEAIMERQNVHEALRFLAWALGSQKFPDAVVQKANKLVAKHSMSGYHNADWTGLRACKFNLVFVSGKISLQLVESIKADPIRVRIPRTIEEISADPKAYGSYLRQLTKTLDRSDEPPGLRNVLEFAEKLYEDRLHIVADRKRLHDLKSFLGILPQAPSKPENFFQKLLRRLGIGSNQAAA
jgi:hypothetical protein